MMIDNDYWQKLYHNSKTIHPTIAIQENHGGSISIYFYQTNQQYINDKNLFFMSCFKDFSAKEYYKDCQNFTQIQEDLAKLTFFEENQFNVENKINESSAGRLMFYFSETNIFADIQHNALNCTTYFDNELQKFIVLETATHFYAFTYQIS